MPRELGRLVAPARALPEALDLLQGDHVGVLDLAGDAREIVAAILTLAVLDVVADQLHGAIVTPSTSWSEIATPRASTAGSVAGSLANRPRQRNQSILPSGGAGVPSGRVRWVGTFSALQARQS